MLFCFNAVISVVSYGMYFLNSCIYFWLILSSFTMICKMTYLAVPQCLHQLILRSKHPSDLCRQGLLTLFIMLVPLLLPLASSDEYGRFSCVI